MNIVLPPDGVPDVKWNKTPSPDQLGACKDVHCTSLDLKIEKSGLKDFPLI